MDRLLMASSDAEAWCRDAPPEKVLGYMVNAQRRLEGYICHLTEIIDTLTYALKLAEEGNRCSACHKLGTESCRMYDAFPRPIRRDDAAEETTPEEARRPELPAAEEGKPEICFYVPQDEKIPTRLRLRVGDTIVRYRECEDGYLIDVYESQEPRAERIARRVAALFERQSDDGCSRLVCSDFRLALRSLIFWEYRAKFSTVMDR